MSKTFTQTPSDGKDIGGEDGTGGSAESRSGSHSGSYSGTQHDPQPMMGLDMDRQ